MKMWEDEIKVVVRRFIFPELSSEVSPTTLCTEYKYSSNTVNVKFSKIYWSCRATVSDRSHQNSIDDWNSKLQGDTNIIITENFQET